MNRILIFSLLITFFNFLVKEPAKAESSGSRRVWAYQCQFTSKYSAADGGEFVWVFIRLTRFAKTELAKVGFIGTCENFDHAEHVCSEAIDLNKQNIKCNSAVLGKEIAYFDFY